MSRGDRREPIFKDDDDLRRFLGALDEAVGGTEWQVHAHWLMTNPIHLVLETPRANLVVGRQRLPSTHAAPRASVRTRGPVLRGCYRQAGWTSASFACRVLA